MAAKSRVTSCRMHVFVCEGLLAVDQEHSLRFTFRVFDDGTLTAEHAPSAAAAVSHDPLCCVYDGRATKRPIEGQDGDVFDCSFRIVRFWRRQLQSQFLVCHTQLSKSGLQGHYVVVRGDDERPRGQEVALPIKLNLPLVEYAQEQVLQPVLPLTPGKYAFTGFTVSQSGAVYECAVSIDLKEDGTLQGSSQDLLFPQQCDVWGKWSSDELVYTLQYKFSTTSCSNYLYTIKPTEGSLRGRWAHEDPSRSVRPTERGHVELMIRSTQRVWSTTFHRLYPQVFRDVTKLLLHKHTRSHHVIPTTVWQHVLMYCDFHHFALPPDAASPGTAA